MGLQIILEQPKVQGYIDQRALNGKRFRLKEEHGLGFTDEFDYSYEGCWPKS